jgi:peptide subunit release factor 1 (eRF1)
MAAITEDEIRQLAGFRGEKAPVTSVYLDVDGRRHVRQRDCEHELERLLRRAQWKVTGAASVADDVRRIEAYVRAGVDRSQTRGLAMFSCTAHDFFEVVTLPVPVRSQLVVNSVPAVRQLEEVVEGLGRLAVLLADRQRTRLFVFEMGELVEQEEEVDELPRDYDQRGERERGDVQHHVDELAAQHLRHAADAVWRSYQEAGFAHLCLGAPDPIARQLESALHPYLRERLGPRLGVTASAGLDEIRRAAADAGALLERRLEQSLVDRLRDDVARGHRAVAGLPAVLGALADRRVEQLLVSQGFSAAGWLCESCDVLADVGRACGRCGAEMRPVDDVVEEVVEHALQQASRVQVCVDNADLDCVGRIGAFLRY